jgi:N-acetylneuraminate lyase
MSYPKLSGLVAATLTPFAPDGRLNLPMVDKHAEHLLAHSVHTAFVGGTTGECQSLTLDERCQLTQRWIDAARGTPLKVLVHVGSNCLADAQTLAAQAQQLGASAIAAFSPSYFKPRNLEALVDCAAQVAAAAPDLPFYFYDIPVMTGVSFPMGDFLESAATRIPNLAGLKFTNPDLATLQLCLHAGGGRFDVPYGTDEWLLAALVLGAKGGVGSTYNFAAPIYHRLIAAFQRGDLETARREQFCSVRVVQALVRYGYLGAAKAIMQILGVDVGPTRLPLASLSPPQVQSLRADLTNLGFFDWVRR